MRNVCFQQGRKCWRVRYFYDKHSCVCYGPANGQSSFGFHFPVLGLPAHRADFSNGGLSVATQESADATPFRACVPCNLPVVCRVDCPWLKMSSAEAFSLFSDELLIEEVRQRPILYDQRLKTYRDKQLQNDAWLEIASALKQSGKCCQLLHGAY